MTIHFSAETGAFYDTDIWPHDLPGDAVEVESERHVALMQDVTVGHVIAANDNGQPIAVEPPSPSEDAMAAFARRERDIRITSIRWLIDRHRDEVALDLTTTLTREDYLLVLAYVQTLRDLPEQEGFPLQIEWPVLPAELLATGG